MNKYAGPYISGTKRDNRLKKYEESNVPEVFLHATVRLLTKFRNIIFKGLICYAII